MTTTIQRFQFVHNCIFTRRLFHGSNFLLIRFDDEHEQFFRLVATNRMDLVNFIGQSVGRTRKDNQFDGHFVSLFQALVGEISKNPNYPASHLLDTLTILGENLRTGCFH